MFQKMRTFGDSSQDLADDQEENLPEIKPQKDQRSKNRRLKDKKSLYRKSRNREFRLKKTKINKRKAKSRRFKDQDQVFLFFF